MTSEESLVVTALSVDEAIILGLTRLAATRDEVHIEVLDEGSRGFLGLGTREARVRLTRRPAAEEVVAPAQLEPEPLVVVPEPEPPAEVVATEPVAVAPDPQPVVVEEKVASKPSVALVPDDSEKSVRARDKDSRGREKDTRERERDVNEQKSQSGDDLDRDMVAQTAVEVAANLFPGLNIQVTTAWQREDRLTLWISLRGKDADVLVGPRAQTLDAVQYLFRTLLHRLVDGNYNVVVDADGYRRRRRRSLESQARKMADQAVKSGRTMRMRPMPAHERRVVHIILRKDKRVKTESTGRGRDRAITIVPVDAADQ